MKTVCTICARSGSKGLPDKNIRPLNGKPLLAYTVESALEAKNLGLIDEIIFTSDSDQYNKIALQSGTLHTILRPEHLAADNVSKLGAIEHAVSTLEASKKITFDTIIDLDVTSPLRNSCDIEHALSLFNANTSANVITASQARRSPYINLIERDKRGFYRPCKPLENKAQQRQQSPDCFDMNASIYIWNRALFKESPEVFNDHTTMYEMPPERSLDIDSALDFEVAEYLIKKHSAIEDAA